MYKRILLKLSGEAIKDDKQNQIINVKELENIARVIKSLHDEKIDICVVIGAGNIWRGKLAKEIHINPVPADFMGMMGTVINAVALSSNLNNQGVPAVVFSAIPEIPNVTKKYEISDVLKSFEEGKVCFLAGGTGKPFYTTDTAAALRACELDCDAIFMGKNGVDGVYDKNPAEFKDAKFLKEVTYSSMLKNKLQIIDLSAVELLQDKNIDVRIFSMSDPNNFLKVAKGEDIGTTLKKGE